MKEQKRLSRCCFTGHRPEKLNVPKETVQERLRQAIRQAISDGFTTFISGMARGVDIWAAEIVLDEREKNTDIKLICTPPFKGFENSWYIKDKMQYDKILIAADFVKFVCEHYSKRCFQIRNKFMVDNSARVIAAFNGEIGGTLNTVYYAKENDVEVVNILDF